MLESDIEQLIKLYNDNHRVSYIVREFPEYSIYEIKSTIDELVNDGILQPRNTEKRYESLINDYLNEQMNPKQLMEKYKYTIHTIYKILHQYNIKITRGTKNYNKRKKTKIEDLSQHTKEILLDINNNLTTGELREKYGITRQYVSYLKNKYIKGEKDE
jgi:hypothetical protein